eukprot:363761-Chlamydomonas_euryale.AAC.3
MAVRRRALRTASAAAAVFAASTVAVGHDRGRERRAAASAAYCAAASRLDDGAKARQRLHGGVRAACRVGGMGGAAVRRAAGRAACRQHPQVGRAAGCRQRRLQVWCEQRCRRWRASPHVQRAAQCNRPRRCGDAAAAVAVVAGHRAARRRGSQRGSEASALHRRPRRGIGDGRGAPHRALAAAAARRAGLLGVPAAAQTAIRRSWRSWRRAPWPAAANKPPKPSPAPRLRATVRVVVHAATAAAARVARAARLPLLALQPLLALPRLRQRRLRRAQPCHLGHPGQRQRTSGQPHLHAPRRRALFQTRAQTALWFIVLY